MNDFFYEENCLQYKKRYSMKREYLYDVKCSLDDILKKIIISNYKVLVKNVNEMKFGYYKEGRFIFSDKSKINPRYLIQMRLFNELEEILIFRNKNKYYIRIIKDEENEESKLIESVDSISVLFGKLDENENLPEGFVKLYDSGRKITKIIPSNIKSNYYTLTTRSYIEYNVKTGQAGYGYYRYVDIKPEK